MNKRLLTRALGVTFWAACLAGAASWAASGCSGWDPKKPFERNAPEVDQAIEDMDAGRLESAEETLERYLGTGACGDAGIQLPDEVRKKPNGSFDLGLVLFSLAERYGKRFGDEELDAGPEEPDKAALRSGEIECALILVKAIAADPSVPAELRARARYLAGNLEFMRRAYEEAVKYYDQALALVPGLLEEAGGDDIGRDAAWNRAIALRRIEDQKDAGPDAEPDSGDDAGPDAEPDSGPDAGDDAGDAGDDAADDAGDDAGPDAGPDGGNDGGDDGGPDGGEGDAGQDAGGDAGQDAGPQDQQPDAGDQPQQPPPPQPQPSTAPQQDERMLDQLEEAPTYQEQEAKARAGVRRGHVMEDK